MSGDTGVRCFFWWSRFLVQLCGIIVGHLYFFLVFKYPQDFGGAQLLKTPSFLSVDLVGIAGVTRMSHLVIATFPMKQRESAALVQLPFLVVKQAELMIRLPIVLVKSLVAVVMSLVINSGGPSSCLYFRLVMCSHLFVSKVKDAMRSATRCSTLTNASPTRMTWFSLLLIPLRCSVTVFLDEYQSFCCCHRHTFIHRETQLATEMSSSTDRR